MKRSSAAIAAQQQAILGQQRKGRKRDYSAELQQQILLTLNVLPIPEYPFHSTRKWRVDIAIFAADGPLAIEIEGVIYPKKGTNDHRLGGRHVSVKGISDDMEKYAALAIAGWRLIRVLPKHVTDGTALKWIEQALKS